MNVVNINDDSDLSSDLIGINSYEPLMPQTQKQGFKGWHKPRKQFVRDLQWIEQVKKLLDNVIGPDKTLTYLGLPGTDFLDIRNFHDEVCEPNNLKLRYLGFCYSARPNSPDNIEYNISYDEISKLPHIDSALSDVLPDDICKISKKGSLAWKKSKELGPFDIINFDICDGFGAHALNEFEDNHYNALRQILVFQSRRSKPWLLFLSSRAGLNHIDPTILPILKEVYNKNLLSCPDFKTISLEEYGVSNAETLEQFCETDPGISNIFMVSICKWLIGTCMSQQPPSKVQVKSVLGYKVEHSVNHKDFVSLAIRFEPTFLLPHDSTGLGSIADPLPSECKLAAQAITKIANITDIDEVLANNAELLEEMTAKSEKLLTLARYDIGTYRQWCESKL